MSEGVYGLWSNTQLSGTVINADYERRRRPCESRASRSARLACMTLSLVLDALYCGVLGAQKPLMHWLVVSQQSAAVVHLLPTCEHIALGGEFEHTRPPSPGSQ